MPAVGDTSNKSFLHPKLQHPHQIRLVTVTGTSPAGRLRCTLHVASLDEDLEYQALSYVWGEGPPKHTILVNGQEFWIRKNLHEFLITLAGGESIKGEDDSNWSDIEGEKESGNEKGSVSAKPFFKTPLFIDAICINQGDIAEREQQVALMHKVYSGAVQVVAWLGPWREMCYFSLVRARGLFDLFNSQIRPEDVDVDPILLESYLKASDEAKHDLFSALTYPPFWGRLWIVQELVLAKSLVLYMGTRLIPRQHFKLLWIGITRNFFSRIGLGGVAGFDIPPQGNGSQILMGWSPDNDFARNIGVAGRILAAGDARAPPYETRLHDLLITWRSQECENPRDILYALLGLTKSHIRVDYDISVTQVFLNVLVQGIIDIAEARTNDVEVVAQYQDQYMFLGICIEGFSYPPNHTTVLLLVYEVVEQHGFLRKRHSFYTFGLFLSALYPLYETYSRDICPRFFRIPVKLCRWLDIVVDQMVGRSISSVTIDPLRFTYSLLQHSTHFGWQLYKFKHIRRSSKVIAMPDGQAGSYSDWAVRISQTADYVKGIGPCPTDVPQCANNILRQQSDQRWQDAFDVFAELALNVCFVALIVRLGAVATLLAPTLLTLFWRLTFVQRAAERLFRTVLRSVR